jgi:hypothetical protein
LGIPGFMELFETGKMNKNYDIRLEIMPVEMNKNPLYNGTIII